MTTRPVLTVQVCPYGCRYFNDGWHMENCPGPPASGASDWSREKGSEGSLAPSAPAPAFLSEPEYAREQAADARDRVYEALDRPLSYTEKGLASE